MKLSFFPAHICSCRASLLELRLTLPIWGAINLAHEVRQRLSGTTLGKNEKISVSKVQENVRGPSSSCTSTYVEWYAIPNVEWLDCVPLIWLKKAIINVNLFLVASLLYHQPHMTFVKGSSWSNGKETKTTGEQTPLQHLSVLLTAIEIIFLLPSTPPSRNCFSIVSQTCFFQAEVKCPIHCTA